MEDCIVKPLRGYSEERIFYVYFHKRPDGSVFYIGKGSKKRAWQKKDRNKHWRNVVDKHGGFDVDIVKTELTEQEAFNLEVELILQYGIENLTNQTIGGISTTGMRHTEESRRLQSIIAIERLKNRPDLNAANLERLKELHDLQRNNPEYKKYMSELQKQLYRSLSTEQREEVIRKKTAWVNDPEKLEQHRLKVKEAITPERRELSRLLMKQLWEDSEYKEKMKLVSKKKWTDPEFKKKLAEIRSKPIVVNRSVKYNSIRDFENKHGKIISQFLKDATDKGYIGYICEGVLIEYYDPNLHSELNNLGFIPITDQIWPRSIGVVANESDVYFSPRELALFLNKPDPETTGDWISKKAKNNQPAFGLQLRVATIEELNSELLRRLRFLVKAADPHEGNNYG